MTRGSKPTGGAESGVQLTALEPGSEVRGVRFAAVKPVDWNGRDLEFWECSFEDCNLESAELQDCTFVGCTFERCNLSLIKIAGCRVRRVTMAATKLMGIDWTRLDWSGPDLGRPLSFADCTLDHSTFMGLDLPKLEMKDCRARELDLRETLLRDADLRGNDFQGSMFEGADLSGADLRGSKNYHINPLRTAIQGARFSLPEALTLLQNLGIDLSDGEA